MGMVKPLITGSTTPYHRVVWDEVHVGNFYAANPREAEILQILEGKQLSRYIFCRNAGYRITTALEDAERIEA